MCVCVCVGSSMLNSCLKKKDHTIGLKDPIIDFIYMSCVGEQQSQHSRLLFFLNPEALSHKRYLAGCQKRMTLLKLCTPR